VTTHPEGCSCFECLLSDLRAELAGESPLVLHPHANTRGQRTTKRDRSDDDQDEASGPIWNAVHGAYGTRIGLPFAVGFERRLGHRDGYGINELALSSIGEVGDWCRSRHVSDLHRSPGRRTSLCERIVSALAEFGQPVGQVAWRESIDEEVAFGIAVNALRHAFAWRHRRLHQFMRLATEKERDHRIACPLCEGRPFRMRIRRPRVA
jgi:hypothetical protein